MAMYFLAETLSFFDSKVPGAVEISDGDYGALFAEPFINRRIGVDKNGRPVLVDMPLPTTEQLADLERGWLDGQLRVTDPLVSRHRDELEEGSETTLTPAWYSELQAYRRSLRNWPENGEFPLREHRPPAPLWLNEQIQ
ncbi:MULTISPECIES: phage tail protein [Pseudomonas]|uniref:phage tail protein n=1 Tax=Pseudomonas TaxID=286 RepID=UPI002361B266|nr:MULTISPECIES: phage tail protein [Pseudomonas]WJV21860.1 phage tail protein [Pseudomonas chlororaphis]